MGAMTLELRRLGWYGAVLFGAASASGCNEATNIGALNKCGVPVEAEAASRARQHSETINFDRLDPGQRGYLKSVTESASRVFVWVRASGAETLPVPFEVAVSSLAEPPDGSGYDLEVVLEGDWCPS